MLLRSRRGSRTFGGFFCFEKRIDSGSQIDCLVSVKDLVTALKLGTDHSLGVDQRDTGIVEDVFRIVLHKLHCQISVGSADWKCRFEVTYEIRHKEHRHILYGSGNGDQASWTKLRLQFGHRGHQLLTMRTGGQDEDEAHHLAALMAEEHIGAVRHANGKFGRRAGDLGAHRKRGGNCGKNYRVSQPAIPTTLRLALL